MKKDDDDENELKHLPLGLQIEIAASYVQASD